MENELESLLQSTASVSGTTPKLVDDLNRLAFLQLETALLESAATSEIALTKARTIRYQPGEAQALFNAGMAASRRQEHEKAKAHFKLALEIRHLLNDAKGIADTLTRLGNAELHTGNYDEALEHYRVAIVIRVEAEDELGAADLYNNSGTIYLVQGHYTLALKSFLRAL